MFKTVAAEHNLQKYIVNMSKKENKESRLKEWKQKALHWKFVRQTECYNENLAKNRYQKRHDKVAKKSHWLLCKKFHLERNDKWYEHVTDSVLENGRFKIFWDFPIQTDKVIEQRRSDTYVSTK